MNKKAFEMSFAWLFAIIVGAVIIFIAIFATSSFIDLERKSSDSKVAAQLGVLLNPIETNLEEAKKATIIFPEQTRVFNSCRTTGNFGRQIISASVKSSIGEEWQEPGAESLFFNKYLFSNSVEQGKELRLMVKPLELPYKIADLTFAYSEELCFVNAPGYIEDEINDLALDNINITNSVAECPGESVKVCFANTGCDIDVNVQSGIASKDGQELYFEGPLIYGAIFSDPGIYECQVKRLAKRNSELAHLHADKTAFLSSSGCSSGIETELRNFAALNGQVESSGEFVTNIVPAAESIRRRNDNLVCKLF